MPRRQRHVPRAVLRAGRGRGHLPQPIERLDGMDHPTAARFILARGYYDVSVDGDTGGGVGRLVTTAVHLDRDQAITLGLR